MPLSEVPKESKYTNTDDAPLVANVRSNANKVTENKIRGKDITTECKDALAVMKRNLSNITDGEQFEILRRQWFIKLFIRQLFR